ncbi:YybH family protein [Pinisolibacter aquiterrae]|uniref:YybH family protein n=1 Tax=Pinisolibacter aquiterrae TaxID=2815579 RepID=UPI001C3D45D9|nr:DUF4440 domain-containing protein [Pinisolibacter aquiterrae]MBV5265935.1 DUF4440 domain-containing protein [Pinisolibacter aquiterrae]MCC8237207.1 DUF4440 domain-containing protein [Pinisolibacter aquiterrae]
MTASDRGEGGHRDVGERPGEGEHPIVALERAALERWCRGDPSGFLEISDTEVGYFEPFVADRLDGLDALTRHYEALRGKIFADDFEMIAPRVVAFGEAAVLSYGFRSRSAGGGETRWQASEVWRRRATGWRIVHTHWSLPR